MAQQERIPKSAVQAAFRRVKRVCYAGLDSVQLRLQIARHTALILPREAYALTTLDPDTGLITHTVGEGLDGPQLGRFFDPVYLYEEAGRLVDLGRTPDRVRIVALPDLRRAPGRASRADAFSDWLASCGLQLELRAAFPDRGHVWGSMCLMRESGAQRFSAREVDFARRLVPHVARGLRAAALIDAAGENQRGAAPAATGRPAAPGVVVIDARGRVTLRSPTAATYIDDLADVGIEVPKTPSSIVSLVGRLRAAHVRTAALSDEAPLAAELRVKGRSGARYYLHAALAEPETADAGMAIILVIDRVERAVFAPMFARLYGLSPREWEVTSLVARGYGTAEIAARLRMSPYTVQDHVDHACEKIGVRGRRRLLARLFLDAHAPALDLPHSHESAVPTETCHGASSSRAFHMR